MIKVEEIAMANETRDRNVKDDALDFIFLQDEMDEIAYEMINLLPRDTAKNLDDEIQKEFNALLKDTRRVTKRKIKVIKNVKILEPPRTKKEGITSIDEIKALDPNLNKILHYKYASNPVMEMHLLGYFDGYLKILIYKGLSRDLVRRSNELKEIAFMKDKVAAVQKWDLLVTAIPTKITKKDEQMMIDFKAFLRTFRVGFFTDLKLY